MNDKLLIGFFLASILILSSCSMSSSVPTDPTTTHYYRGYEGIRMTIDPGSLPSTLYYYANAPDSYNAFSVDVEVHNVGASWSRGGIYVSGHDPSLIFLEGVNVPKTSGGFWEHCQTRLSMGDWDWSNIAGVLNCNFGDHGASFTGDPNTDQAIDGVSINNLFGFFGAGDAINDLLSRSELLTRLGLNELGNMDVDLTWDGQTDAYAFNFDFSEFGLNLDVLHHGAALMILMDSLSFDRFNGKSFYLAADNYDYPGGELTYISFPGYVRDTWPAGLDSTPVTFMISSCYAYSTYATPLVCIDPDPSSQNQKVCYPGQVSLAGSQGAPVAVTGVHQESGRLSTTFTIEISNVGHGKVIYPGDLELCSPYYPGALTRKNTDLVILGDIRMSGSDQRLRCTPDDNIVRLNPMTGKGQIICTYDYEYATSKSAYKAPLVIELWYGYSEELQRTINIKRAR